MGCLKKGSLLFPGYHRLNKIILMFISISCPFSSSITVASNEYLVPLSSSKVPVQRIQKFLKNDLFSKNNDRASILDELFKRAVIGKRTRRNNGTDASEKNHNTSSHDKGTNSQEDSFEDVDGISSADEFKRKHLYLLLAQQEAKCLQEFGKLEPTISFDFPQDLFRPFVCLEGSRNFSACEQCIKMIWMVSASQANRISEATGGLLKYSNASLMTNVFCESIKQPLSKTLTTSSSVLTTSRTSQNTATNNPHFVYLKSIFSDAGDRIEAKRAVPVVFVIEQREFVNNSGGPTRDDGRGNWTGWRTLGKSPYGFEKIQVAYRQETYQWRVTAVGIHGPLAVSIVKSFETLDGYMEPGPPTGVFVIENKPKESTVDVLLGWDPPQERACFYKIVLETRNDEQPTRTLRIKGEPLGVHKVWFRRLKFDSTYEVRITSRSADWHENESTHASLSFTTPACLDAHHYRFDKCAPPPPRSLSFSVKAGSSSNVTAAVVNPTTSFKKYFTANLMWKPPAHASKTNSIEQYVVDIRAFSWNVRRSRKSMSSYEKNSSKMVDPGQLLTPRRLRLPGNVTHVRLDNLDETAEYTVHVSAVSSKGSSPAASLTIKLHSETGSLRTNVSFWVYQCDIILTVLVIASGFHAVKRIKRSRQMKAASDSYFKAIDQRDDLAVEWCGVSLTEDPRSTWKVLEQNSVHKDKWHVSFQDLTVGGIIGRGAFGIVREAEIKRDKYLELLKRHKTKTLDTHFQMCGAELSKDKTGMEKVALKMLRVAATKADREDLLKELLTMQSLGMHPQIVTLLGVCTAPKSMCLVLEYCPGGDLLSFLRKFREKYLPMLNLTCGKKQGVWCENPEYKRRSHEEKMSCESEDETAECESINEKEVLSYARQIAVGMAYLERNHIIHRDLACRNILVMEDHKRIKISDFGLSRDIYTRNVYRQKTEGKVPFKWMALESINSRVFTSKSDVWSFGIVLWELVTLGAVPYPSVENQELLKLLRTGYRMERPDNCSEELKCWRTVPADRPNFTELRMYLEALIESEPELYLTLQP